MVVRRPLDRALVTAPLAAIAPGECGYQGGRSAANRKIPGILDAERRKIEGKEPKVSVVRAPADALPVREIAAVELVRIPSACGHQIDIFVGDPGDHSAVRRR